jgi:chaperone BCS1
VWTPVVFDHPATFETVALEPEEKQKIIEDLKRFSMGEKYYRRVGRAWKRGYLLYGPPGTGKSSMIVAMANFLEYDIYDLELTQVKNNTELRKLLIATTNKSIIVIEDIDCSLDLSDRKKKKKQQQKEKPSEPDEPDESESNEDSKVTLSGVLNFTDGLWSCCGSERLFVFTTNHIDRLDPALLRSGRMDRHIFLSFCTFGAFKILARNYLSIEDHELFSEIQDLIEAAQMTPADVTEHLMKMADDPTTALHDLIEALREAKERTAIAALNGCISEENVSATVQDQV